MDGWPDSARCGVSRLRGRRRTPPAPGAGDHHRHGKGTHSRWSPLLEDGMRLLDLLEPSDGTAHQHAHLVTICLRDVEPGLLERLLGGHHRKLHEPRHPASFLAIETGLRFEVDHFAGHLAGGRGWVEGLHPASPRPASLHGFPGLAGCVSERGDGSGARDDHPGAIHHSTVPPPPQRTHAAAQDGPLPQPRSSAVIPLCSRPSTTVSCKAIRGAAASSDP